MSDSSATGGLSYTYRKSQPDVDSGVDKGTQNVDCGFKLGCIVAHKAIVAVNGLRHAKSAAVHIRIGRCMRSWERSRTSTDATKMASPSIACCR